MNLMFALLVLTAGDTKLTVSNEPMRVGLERGGAAVAAAHPGGSLLLGDPQRPEPVSVTGESFNAQGHRVLAVKTASGLTATVTVALTPNQVDLVVRPASPSAVVLRFAGMSPGFGLGDHAVTGRESYDTDCCGAG